MKRMIQMVVPVAIAAAACGGVGDEVETSTTTQAVTGENGLATNGIWENGIWENGIWENGIWENGIWENGIWENGFDAGGRWINGSWGPGIWKSENWRDNPAAKAVLRDNRYTAQLLQYLYSCAMPAGATHEINAGDGVTVSLAGAIGLWPTWPKATTCDANCTTAREHWQGLMPGVTVGECDESCQRWISACVLARTNAYGVHVQISMRAPDNAPQAIKDALELSTSDTGGIDEAGEFSLREGAYYGNLFQTYRDSTTGRLANNPVFFACAGPGSNIPAITKRFCSSQGADGVITNTGMCEPTLGHVAACDGTLGVDGAVQNCAAPASGHVLATSYREVITVYLRTPIAVCGNSVCEEGEDTGESDACPTDCHPDSWAKSFDQFYVPGVMEPPNGSLPVISTSAISPVDDSVVVAGAVYGIIDIDLDPDETRGQLPGSPTNPNWDLVLAKYDRDGNYLWGQRLPQSERLTPGAVAIDNAGNIAVAAHREAPSDQLWIGKFDAAGSSLPGGTHLYGGSANLGIADVAIHRAGLAFDASGNLVLTSTFVGQATFGELTLTSEDFETDPTQPDTFVLSLGSDGSVNWAQSLGGDHPGQLALDAAGNVHVGIVDAPNNNRVVKLAATGGSPIWSRNVPNTRESANEQSVGVAVDSSGNVFVTGKQNEVFPFRGTAYERENDLYVAKFASDGGPQWIRYANAHIAASGGSTEVRGSHIAVTSTGDVIVGGDFVTDNGALLGFGRLSLAGFPGGILQSAQMGDLVVLNFRSSDGELQWLKDIPAVLASMSHSLKIDSRDHMVLAGHFNGSMLVEDRLLVNGIPELPDHPNVFLASIPPPPPPGVDTTPPTLERLPEPIFVQATSGLGARVWYMPPLAHDAGNHGVNVYCSPAPNSIFPRGATTVTCTATDPHGNAASDTFPVIVGDDLGPVISGLGPIEVPAIWPTGAPVSYAMPTAKDQVDGVRPVGCTHPPGTVFPIGTTTVRCASTDASGNTTTRSFPVTVVDKTPPDITVPKDFTVPATSGGGAVVSYTVKGYDVVDGTVPVTCTPKSKTWFKLGHTIVVCKAIDKSGNQAESKFMVKVEVQWSGILQPVNADGSSIYKIGSNIPLRFMLTGASSEITDLKATWTLTKLRKDVTGTVYEKETAQYADTGNVFRYDLKTNQYAFNLSTKSLTYGDWLLGIDMGDGTARSVKFSVK